MVKICVGFPPFIGICNPDGLSIRTLNPSQRIANARVQREMDCKSTSADTP